MNRIIATSRFAATFVLVSSIGLTDVYGQVILEEIVVTAQKREEALMDTPLAVSAFTSEELDRLGARDIRDLADSVPALHFSDSFTGATVITLRGIETNNTGSIFDPAVAYHIDGVYQARPTNFLGTFHDIERLEVSRGPQGTLYGRNATAGGINVLTRRPTDDLEGRLDFGFGNYSYMSAKGVLNIPVSDTFKLRGSFVVDKRDGFNTTEGSIDLAGNPIIIDDENQFYNSDSSSVRIGALFEPNDNLSWYISLDHFTSDSIPTIFGSIMPPDFDGDVRNVGVARVPTHDTENTALRTRIDWDFSDTMQFSYIAGFASEEIERSRTTAIQNPTILFSSTPAEVDYTSHEFQLKSTGDTALQWLAGLYYFEEENASPEFEIRFGSLMAPTTNFLFGQTNRTDEQSSEAYALFTQGTYSISDTLRFTAGIRFTHDEKNTVNSRTERFINPRFFPPGMFNPMAPDVLISVGEGPSSNGGRDWDNTSWKLGLDWNTSENTLMYANISTGYKAGGYSLTANTTWNEENILAYEFGTKSVLRDGRTNLSTTIFYYDYEDFQANAIVPDPINPGNLISTTSNAANASVSGIEVELATAVGENGRLTGFVSFLDTEFDEFPLAPADPAFTPPGPMTLVPVDLSGNELPKAPESELTLNYLHSIPLTSGALLTPSFSVYWKDDHFLRFYNAPIDLVEGEATMDANLRYDSPDGSWYIEAFGKNITDEDVVTVAFQGGPLTYTKAYNPPKTYGVRFGINWE